MPEPTSLPPMPLSPPEGKKSKSKVVFLVTGLLLVLALTSAGCFLKGRSASANSGKKGSPTLSKQPASPPAAVVQLDPFIVNLADTEHSTYLRMGITLGLKKAWSQGGEDAGPSPMLPEIRDSIVGVVTNWQSRDLLAPGGKSKLKAQILQALQSRVPEAGITDVYLTDFLIQE
jgi:flagellar basal body-associated protein FliL